MPSCAIVGVSVSLQTLGAGGSFPVYLRMSCLSGLKARIIQVAFGGLHEGLLCGNLGLETYEGEG